MFQNVSALEPDSTSADDTKVHSVTKAVVMSAIIPGLGQIYNRKYWKPPLIYAGAGILVYYVIDNSNEYQQYKLAYSASLNGTPCDPSVQELCDRNTQAQLKAKKDQFRRWRDLNYILAGGLYLLNIIDASVDAHLFSFDMGDDLSLRIKWNLNNYAAKSVLTPQLNLSIKL